MDDTTPAVVCVVHALSALTIYSYWNPGIIMITLTLCNAGKDMRYTFPVHTGTLLLFLQKTNLKVCNVRGHYLQPWVCRHTHIYIFTAFAVCLLLRCMLVIVPRKVYTSVMRNTARRSNMFTKHVLLRPPSTNVACAHVILAQCVTFNFVLRLACIQYMLAYRKGAAHNAGVYLS